MQTANPHKLEPLGLWHGTENDEAALHAMFGVRRVRGEWFSLTAEDIARLRELMEAKPPDVSLPPPCVNSLDPKSLPDLKFPPGIDVEVRGAGCTWCARWLRFVGEINYLVCECRGKVPMGTIICNAYRRECVEKVMREHALP